MKILGHQLIGLSSYAGSNNAIQPINPATGEALAPHFNGASTSDIKSACSLASSAFDIYRETSLEDRANFLENIAAEIENLGDPLIDRAVAETGLSKDRIVGERGRTCSQLRMFADLVRKGDWLGVSINPAIPDRQPNPRPDLRLRHIPVGPVAVFGASNFPLAFSVAGGDTASALAAGCPVVVKGHSAHPGTSELVGRAIQSAVKASGMPEGTFSLIFGVGNYVGEELVTNPCIQAVGFTGSRVGGLKLLELAQQREVPIPVFAEMSSVNPVFIFPNAILSRSQSIASGFIKSLNNGAGQFCTNPGIIIACKGKDLDAFKQQCIDAIKQEESYVMLTKGIHESYLNRVDVLREYPDVSNIAVGQESNLSNTCKPHLYLTDAKKFISDKALHEEHFGASSLIVECEDIDEMHSVAQSLEGQLTATLQIDEADYKSSKSLIHLLETKAGRILINGWPTGVEVCSAMVHGGPYPATTDSRFTSVGSLSIDRFLRPVCYQGFPEDLLPSALR